MYIYINQSSNSEAKYLFRDILNQCLHVMVCSVELFSGLAQKKQRIHLFHIKFIYLNEVMITLGRYFFSHAYKRGETCLSSGVIL